MSEWIKIEDQTPQQDRPYLVKLETLGFHYGPDPIRGWDLPINADDRRDDHRDKFFKVTHWKPIG